LKIVCENRAASFEYFIEERYEAGIVLEGAEVKSVRSGNCNLKDSFCFIRNGDVILKNMHIANYDKSGKFNSTDSKRDRKLLMHKQEIGKITGKINEKGYTLIPLEVYFKESLVKVQLGLCKGKHTYDKKKVKAEKDLKIYAERQIKEYLKK